MEAEAEAEAVEAEAEAVEATTAEAAAVEVAEAQTAEAQEAEAQELVLEAEDAQHDRDATIENHSAIALKNPSLARSLHEELGLRESSRLTDEAADLLL
eukprot:1372282-Prymnesium_polylepis.1